MATAPLTCGAEACAAIHTSHCHNEQSVGARAVLVQVGELGGAVVVAKLKHLGEKAVGSLGTGNATLCVLPGHSSFFEVFGIVWF